MPKPMSAEEFLKLHPPSRGKTCAVCGLPLAVKRELAKLTDHYGGQGLVRYLVKAHGISNITDSQINYHTRKQHGWT